MYAEDFATKLASWSLHEQEDADLPVCHHVLVQVLDRLNRTWCALKVMLGNFIVAKVMSSEGLKTCQPCIWDGAKTRIVQVKFQSVAVLSCSL